MVGGSSSSELDELAFLRRAGGDWGLGAGSFSDSDPELEEEEAASLDRDFCLTTGLLDGDFFLFSGLLEGGRGLLSGSLSELLDEDFCGCSGGSCSELLEDCLAFLRTFWGEGDCRV